MSKRLNEPFQAEANTHERLEPVAAPYLLVTGIPCYVDPNGRRWTDALWSKDLAGHLLYIRDFTLACPVRVEEPPRGSTCLSDDPRFAGVGYIDLPPSDSKLMGILHWPKTFWRLWRGVGHARIVHAGVADWPIPTGWAATIAAVLRRRALLINIESAFWRVPPTAPVAKRLESFVWETVNRWCVRRATLPLFTQDEYLRQMLPGAGRGHVLQASWIDDDVILSDASAAESWREKQSDRPLRVLFAGRLIADKGISELLEAMDDRTLGVRLDLIGEGKLLDAVMKASQTNGNIRYLDPVPYGPEFFRLLRHYHAVVVPSKSDEQPRIVYDAYSQAVPILGTRTPGIEACVTEGETGYLAAPASVPGLRDMLRRADADRPALRRMGLHALDVAKQYTHREMHLRRWRLLKRTLPL